jgi:hypothetical protein
MPTDIEAELDALHDMTTGELADLYRELHGQPCRTRHRAYLIRKNAWRIQANAEGVFATSGAADGSATNCVSHSCRGV